METDPFAMSGVARTNADMVERLRAITFPQVPSWQGVAAELYRNRLDMLARRRDELLDVHREAARLLQELSSSTQQTLDDLGWRNHQRTQALNDLRTLRAALALAVDPSERARLEAEERIALAAHQRANDQWHELKADLIRRDTRVAALLRDLAHFADLPSLANQIWHLPLVDFQTYRAMVLARQQPENGINWTNDGCSDNHLVTRTDSDPACIRHDFGYRNWPALAPTKGAAKAQVDRQFGMDLVALCSPPTTYLAWNSPTGDLLSCNRVAMLGFLGVALFGRPNVTEMGGTPKKSLLNETNGDG